MLSWGLFPITYAPTQTCTVWDIQVCLLGPSHPSPSCLQPLYTLCFWSPSLSPSRLPRASLDPHA